MSKCEICKDTISRFDNDVRVPEALLNYLSIIHNSP